MKTATQQIARELERLSLEAGERPAQDVLEHYLEQVLAGASSKEKLQVVDELIGSFSEASGVPRGAADSGAGLAEFFTMILGRKVGAEELERPEVRERLSSALQDVFNGLNRLLQAIDDTMGKEKPLDRTIRQLVHGQLAEELADQSLGEVIDRIRQAFLTSYEASKTSHLAILDRILADLDPQRILDDCEGGLKIGPLRKAEAFDSYCRLYGTLGDWHRSGRGLVEYLNIFERHCGSESNKPGEE